MKTVLASRLVWADSGGNLRIRMDCGVYSIESSVSASPVRSLQVNPEAMDRLVREWPKLREMATDVRGNPQK